MIKASRGIVLCDYNICLLPGNRETTVWFITGFCNGYSNFARRAPATEVYRLKLDAEPEAAAIDRNLAVRIFTPFEEGYCHEEG